MHGGGAALADASGYEEAGWREFVRHSLTYRIHSTGLRRVAMFNGRPLGLRLSATE
jgi:hypothetical protein